MKKCITVSGKTGSGKDTVSNMIINKYGYKRYSFGDPVREFMQKALPNIDYHDNFEARKVIVNVVEEPKKIAPACWAFYVTEQIANDCYPDKIIIPDLRFDVELNHLCNVITRVDFGEGYELIKLKIVGYDDRHIIERANRNPQSKEGLLIFELYNHPSNTEHEKWDFYEEVTNFGTIKELENKVKKIMENI